MKDKICDALFVVVMLVLYSSAVLAVCGLVLARWSLCWVGLSLAAIIIVAISVGRTADDLRDIARYNTPARTLWCGLRTVAEAVVCISLYLLVMPIVLFVDGLAHVAEKLKT